jgi:hypothetical protein
MGSICVNIVLHTGLEFPKNKKTPLWVLHRDSSRGRVPAWCTSRRSPDEAEGRSGLGAFDCGAPDLNAEVVGLLLAWNEELERQAGGRAGVGRSAIHAPCQQLAVLADLEGLVRAERARQDETEVNARVDANPDEYLDARNGHVGSRPREQRQSHGLLAGIAMAVGRHRKRRVRNVVRLARGRHRSGGQKHQNAKQHRLKRHRLTPWVVGVRCSRAGAEL